MTKDRPSIPTKFAGYLEPHVYTTSAEAKTYFRGDKPTWKAIFQEGRHGGIWFTDWGKLQFAGPFDFSGLLAYLKAHPDMERAGLMWLHGEADKIVAEVKQELKMARWGRGDLDPDDLKAVDLQPDRGE